MCFFVTYDKNCTYQNLSYLRWAIPWATSSHKWTFSFSLSTFSGYLYYLKKVQSPHQFVPRRTVLLYLFNSSLFVMTSTHSHPDLNVKSASAKCKDEDFSLTVFTYATDVCSLYVTVICSIEELFFKSLLKTVINPWNIQSFLSAWFTLSNWGTYINFPFSVCKMMACFSMSCQLEVRLRVNMTQT